MSFWQENLGFIQDVFDNRADKLVEVMDKTEKAIAEVKADKIYTSNDFKKVKENFTSLAKNMENSEVKDWLNSMKETLQGSSAKSKNENDTLNKVLDRFDKMGSTVAETKTLADSLWQGYNYTDELTPHVEWLEDKKTLANRDVNSNSAGETEELIEKQEKVIDQLDKKRKVIQAILDKGTKLMNAPKSPEFLAREVKRASDLYKETTNSAEDRLQRLRENLAAWEQFESKRNGLAAALDGADKELEDINKLYELAAGVEDHKNRVKGAVGIRKEIGTLLKVVQDANNIVQVLLTDDMKAELDGQVEELKSRGDVNDKIDERLKDIDQFNGKLKVYIEVLEEMEKWTGEGRKRMDGLLDPPADMEAEDRVLQTMELGEDISAQLETHAAQQEKWDSGEIGPAKQSEISPDSKALATRMDAVKGLLEGLNSESETEAAKFGEDVKYLADVTNSTKKFDPWIAKSEAKVKAGLPKAASLDEGKKLNDEVIHWKKESEAMKTVLDNGNAAAQKMSTHGEADKVYAANIKKWEIVDKAIKDWIGKMEALVKMWEDQAATADKVTNAISASDSDMKLEDLEAHLNSLKAMFIEKQKMMDAMNPTEA